MTTNSNTNKSSQGPLFSGIYSFITGESKDSKSEKTKISNPMEQLILKKHASKLVKNSKQFKSFEKIFQNLVQLGYPHKQIFNAILIWKFQTIDEYIDAFSEQNGKINHNFEASDFDLCFVCQRVEEQHNEFIQDGNKGIELNKTNGQSKESKDIELKIKELKDFNKIIPDNNKNNIIAPNNNNICQICFDEMSSKTFQLKCAHLFCKECIMEYLKEEINNSRVAKINCPYPKCKQQFTENNITDLLSKEYVTKYKRFIFREKFKSGPSYVSCPILNCDGYAKSKKSSSKQVRLECNYGHPFCSQCNQAWHYEEPCTNDQEIKDFATYSGFILKKCPKCKAWTEKNEGCNHMHCQACEFDWCWLCEQHFPKGHYYQSGPCYGKLYVNQEVDFDQMENQLILNKTPWIIQCLFSLYVLTIFYIRTSITRILKKKNDKANRLIPYEEIENNIKHVKFDNTFLVLQGGQTLIKNDIIVVGEPKDDIPPKHALLIHFYCWIITIFVGGLCINLFMLAAIMFNGTSVSSRGLITKKLWSLSKILILLVSYATFGPILTFIWFIFTLGYSTWAIIKV